MQLVEQMLKCSCCPELVESRTKIIIGEGTVPCKIVIIGEAPGQQENQIGRPFIGPSGKTLRGLLKRAEIYDYHILNVLKCKPPNNRDPKKEELQNCKKFLEAQLDIIKPQLIIAVGKYAIAWALEKAPEEIKVTEHAGTHILKGKCNIFLTFHPAYIMRQQKHSLMLKHFKEAKKLLE